MARLVFLLDWIHRHLSPSLELTSELFSSISSPRRWSQLRTLSPSTPSIFLLSPWLCMKIGTSQYRWWSRWEINKHRETLELHSSAWVEWTRIQPRSFARDIELWDPKEHPRRRDWRISNKVLVLGRLQKLLGESKMDAECLLALKN